MATVLATADAKMELLTPKNIKRARKAVKYGLAFANAYNEMSQVLPINDLLPDFMTNNIFSQTMGATLKTMNEMKSAKEKKDCLLSGIKQDLERGDVSQFEMLMQAMQAYAQRENDRSVNELMQRMYGDIYGDVGGGGSDVYGGLPAAPNYNASAFGVNDSLRCMLDNCSISPEVERRRQPLGNSSMIPHHHTDINDDASHMQSLFSGTRS